MNIEEMLGAELYKQVQAALKGKLEGGKDAILVIGNDGSYLPKEKFDQLNEKLKTSEQLAANTKKALDDLKSAGDAGELSKALEETKAQVEKLKTDYDAEKKALELDYAIKSRLADAQDTDIVAGLLDKGKLKLDGGEVKGLEDQLKGLRESKPFLFAAKDAIKPPINGLKPAEGSGGGQPGATYTREQVAAMTPEQINANWDAVSASMKNF